MEGLPLIDGLAETLGLAQIDVQICEALKQNDGTLAMEVKDCEHEELRTAVLSNLKAVAVAVDEQRLGGKDVRRLLRMKDTEDNNARGWSQHGSTDVKRFPSRIRFCKEVSGANISPRMPFVVRRLSLRSSAGKEMSPVNKPDG